MGDEYASLGLVSGSCSPPTATTPTASEPCSDDLPIWSSLAVASMSVPKLADDASPGQALSHLLKVLGPLFKLPTRKAAAGPSSSTPTAAALEAFQAAVPEAAPALSGLEPATIEEEDVVGQPPWLARQRLLARAGGKLALWAVGRVDELIRADEALAVAGGASLPWAP